jgi:hypothetical protein
VLNILVPQVELNCSRVLVGVRQVEAGRVPEHVRVNWALDVGSRAPVHYLQRLFISLSGYCIALICKRVTALLAKDRKRIAQRRVGNLY